MFLKIEINEKLTRNNVYNLKFNRNKILIEKVNLIGYKLFK